MNFLPYVHLVSRCAIFCTLCGVAASSTTAHAQGFNNLGHQSWSTENGLPQNSVHQIFQSRDGYIWIATEGGVARFNSIDFKVFNHENTAAFTSDDICCFTQDSAGSLWIGTADGLLTYSAGTFRRFSTTDGLPSGAITSLAAGDDGTVLVVTGNGVTRFDGRRFSPLPLPSSAIPSAVVSAGDGSIWIASTSGVLQYRHGQFRSQSFSPGLSTAGIESLGVLPGDGLWLRTANALTLYQNDQLRTLQAGREIPATRIQSVLADSRGDLWIGTNQGLFVMDKISDRLQPLTALGSNSILSIFQGREGNLWIGTETSGFDILRQQNFHTLPGLPDHVITAITQTSGGAMWVGTNGDGLSRWQSGTTQHFSTSNGLLSEVILALTPGANDSVWVGTPDGLNHLEGTKVETYTSADGLPDDLIRSLLSDNDGGLWIGTRRGLAHWKNNQFITLTRANGLNSDLIGTLLQSHSSGSAHDLWIGTFDGLSRLHDGKITTFTTKDGLSGNIITSLAEDPGGMLWIGTKGDGLSTWSTSHGFTSLHRSDLPQNIDSILEDDHGNLWLSSTRGITRVSATSLIACGSSPGCDPHPVSYGRSDGMPTEEASAIGHPAAWKTTEGHLWFATRKGVAITDSGHLAENHLSPPVVIERFTADGIELPVSSTEQNISFGHNSFAFQYVGLSYVNPAKVRYRYILEGFDKQWTEAGSRRIAYYTNLSARHYRFRVQAANNDGLWNEAGAQITFYVRPPFYRTLWFLLLVILLLASIAILLYQLRVRRLQSQFQAVLAERNRVAREIHDTLAQSFVGVSVQLELTAQLLLQSQVSAASTQIDRTREYVREGLAEARRSIWDLRAVTAQHALTTRLTRLAEQSATEQLSVRLNIGGTYRPLAATFEDEVFRIAQESLTNVARHANATQAFVDLRYDSNRLTVIISDDGCGFHATDESLPDKGHFGLQGMRERAYQIHAQLTIESSQGKGTTITLDAPIVVEKGAVNNG
jgi:signal transduction histidine kinase/ligand-binding sensor domain-containing protein